MGPGVQTTPKSDIVSLEIETHVGSAQTIPSPTSPHPGTSRDCQEFWKLWNHMPQPSELFEQAADAMGRWDAGLKNCGNQLWEPLGMRGN